MSKTIKAGDTVPCPVCGKNVPFEPQEGAERLVAYHNCNIIRGISRRGVVSVPDWAKINKRIKPVRIHDDISVMEGVE